MKELSYKDRLMALDLSTLELHRLGADLTMCFKILNGHVAGTPENFELTLSGVGTMGHNKKLYVQHSRIKSRRNFFWLKSGFSLEFTPCRSDKQLKHT